MSTPEPRGELIATLGGREFKLRADFDMVRRVELRTGAGIFKIVSRTSAGNVHAGDIAAILSEAATSAGTRLTFAEAGELLMRHPTDAAKAASECLQAAMAGEEAPGPKA